MDGRPGDGEGLPEAGLEAAQLSIWGGYWGARARWREYGAGHRTKQKEVGKWFAGSSWAQEEGTWFTKRERGTFGSGLHSGSLVY